MSLESVRAFLTANAPELSVTVTDKSSATVLLAAEALGVEPGQIAKTLSVRVGDRVVLVVTKGTARLDNKKARDALGGKPRMLGADEVVALTGHPVRRRLPVRPGNAITSLLRRVAEGIRRGVAGGGLGQQFGADVPGTDGRTDRGQLGRCLPGAGGSAGASSRDGLRQRE
ncbi:Aminoacyl-tRNA editing domain-containing protein [Tardiphaga sp. OK246]|jgi:hypothetical protein|nr:Aminoacyl-tRNA editing domain-containing protein [Tardiphaga sp. OK246]